MEASEVQNKGQGAVPTDDPLLRSLKDYTSLTVTLIWQRQIIFLAATLLTAFYFNPILASIFYGTIMFTEALDIMLARRVKKLNQNDKAGISSSLYWVIANTALSSGNICLYAITVALQQQGGGHFTSLFFLFAAALFAAMNNHQIVIVLVLRLVIYGVSFLVIVLKDVWVMRPPLSSELWLHVFTVVFVMYFIIDCSFIFLKLYRKNLKQIEDLRQEHELAKSAYLAKSQFVSTVSHELRTPLTSIKGSLDLINSGALGEIPEKMQRLIQLAGSNSERLSNLIDDLLDIQKIEAGEMSYRQDVLSVQDLIGEAIDSSLGYASAHDVAIVKESANCDPLFIKGDEARLMQVMLNMISNAIKFSREHGVVTVGCEHTADKVRIFVVDTGIGIPASSKDKVFGRFTQVDSSDQRHVGGTGLGMSISKEIVENLDGIIDYVSEPGKGTRFFIEFDACETDLSHEGCEEQEHAASAYHQAV
ncbi:MAG: HAMP domain-containing histidine kinase [Rhodobacteraceae bacterium]|nr:HAMP domain-containing histidine kinase [Paracoccaceae bacterium]